ncbi:MAG: hypothetical protein EBX41_02695 [Chitinophagia bacterium]|nr:hypothetical protein [Chitinophagia bacterium]
MRQVFYILVAVLSMMVSNVYAQNLGKQNEWFTDAPNNIPMKGGAPYYDTLVLMSHHFTKEKLHNNAEYYFNNIFGSKLIQKNSDYSYTALAHYYMTTEKSNMPEHIYRVSYVLEINIHNGRYSATMRDFVIERRNELVDFYTTYKSALDSQNGECRRFLAIFNKKNTDELKVVYNTMRTNINSQDGTASR